MMNFDVNWEDPNWNNVYFEAFDQLEIEMTRPLDLILEEADLGKFKPKIIKKDSSKETGNEREENVPSAFDEDNEFKKSFFYPPLQFQRNQFVIKCLLDFRAETFDLTKICIMGCGEMSLEKAMLEVFGKLSTKIVLSVDLDDESLARGAKLLELEIKEKSDYYGIVPGLPVLMRSYLGTILQVDNRFANADAIISLEVIEHMPLKDARNFVSTVLGVLRPRIFIFSTPNHDYNQAFGDKPGEFRHDDHKFEMSIQEFDNYLEELRRQFVEYQIENPQYIGQLKGFEYLKGATQAAICKLNENIISFVEKDFLSYKTVSQIKLPIGQKMVEERLIKQAFIEWLNMAKLREIELIEGKFSKYWLINIKNVLHHLHAPISFVSQINEIEALEVLRIITKSAIQCEFSHGFNGFTIPSDIGKEKLLEIVKGK